MQPLTSKMKQNGFSLVEIMIGMVISLISMVIILQIFTAFEGQKRTSTSGSDAQSIGTISMFNIERDVRNAGYGMTDQGLLGCKINASFNGTLLPTQTLMPLQITQGAGTRPDRIDVMASGKTSFSIPARITVDHPASATNFFINSTQGMQVNDIMIAYQPGLDCTVVQITGIPNGNVQIHHQSTSPWNPPGGQNIFPPGGYSAGAILFNFGALLSHSYYVDSANKLILQNLNTSNNTSSTQEMNSDVANMQAQYGFDTRAGTQSTAIVDTWSDTLIDADGDGTVGNGGDIQRMIAIRLALSIRSTRKEPPAPAIGCNITTAAPTWAGGTLDVSKYPDGKSFPDWKCYRYKTFETIIPLRNIIWGQ